MLFKAGLCCGVVHQRVDGGADLPVGSVGPDDQLEDRAVPAAMWRHRRGDPGCLGIVGLFFLLQVDRRTERD